MKGLKIFTPEDFPLEFRTAITIGSFDGIHLGHKALLQRAKELANELKATPVVVTFDPHPRKVLFPESHFKLLTTIEEKLELIEKEGINHICLVPFTRVLAELSADLFVEKYLVDGLKVQAVVVGFNFRFGKGREGNIDVLKRLGRVFEFRAESLGPIKVNGLTVSSSTIRGLIEKGEVEKAGELLGHPYFFSGEVIKGKGRGVKLGFPTANLKVPEEKLLPPPGVYGVKAMVKGQKFFGAMNIGRNPTFDEKELSVEVHLFDFSGNLYGEVLRVEVLKFVREEKKFASPEELRLQIKKDCEFLKNYFKSFPLS